MTTTTTRTDNQTIYEYYLSKLNKTLVNEANYNFYTIIAPTIKDERKQQEYLINYVSHLDFQSLVCLEFANSDNRDGWHLHIISIEQPPTTKAILLHHSIHLNRSIQNAIGYLAQQTKRYNGKEDEKQYFYNCGTGTRDLMSGQPINKQYELDFELNEEKEIEACIAQLLDEVGVNSSKTQTSHNNANKELNKSLWNKLIQIITGINQKKIFDG